MDYEERARIATAEGVDLELDLAGLGSRGSARLLDVIIQSIILLAVAVFFGLVFADSDIAEAVIAITAALISFVVLWGYDTLFETFNSGQTPGKRRLGIRVVSEAGGGLTFRMAAIRSIMRIVDEGTLLLGALFSIARSARSQRLGDMAAGTLVVRDAASVDDSPSSREFRLRESSWRLLEQAGGWDTSAISAEDAATIRQYLDRRAVLDPRRRRELTGEMAARLRPRVPGAEEGIDPEVFLEVVAALKARRG